uniref:VQ domain-containing protein n=1 Tax=Kalanchoe fedtschenkoi TaxID=63787 RepID=A0A7N0RE87_KALFE
MLVIYVDKHPSVFGSRIYIHTKLFSYIYMMGSFHPSEVHRQRDHQQLKVTFIETHYIQTDAESFKSVVQTLTGKDSSSCNVTRVKEVATLGSLLPSKPVAPDVSSRPSYTPQLLEEDYCFRSGPGGASVLDKQTSFRDFEKLISQLSAVEDVFHFLDNL